MVNIGIVGVGFMGVTHYKAVDQVNGGKVAALASRDETKRRGDWRSIQGNFGGGGGVQDLSRVRCYESLDELLADPAIDLVDICLPTTLHVETSMRALAAGKHVLLEKPIAVNLRDADKIMAAAKKHRRQFMGAHVLRYFPEFRLIKKMVAGGEYGKVLAAHFKRIISRPAWWAPLAARFSIVGITNICQNLIPWPCKLVRSQIDFDNHISSYASSNCSRLPDVNDKTAFFRLETFEDTSNVVTCTRFFHFGSGTITTTATPFSRCGFVCLIVTPHFCLLGWFRLALSRSRTCTLIV